MKHASISFSVTFLSILAGYFLIHNPYPSRAQSTGKAGSSHPSAQPTSPRLPQEMIAPCWTLEPGWDSELELRNNLLQESLTVQPVLRSATGEEFPLSPVTLAPNELRIVGLREAAALAAPNLIDVP